MSKTWRGMAVFALLLGVVAIAAGCGSNGSSESSGGTTASTEGESGSGEGSASSLQQESKEYVAEHSDLETMEWPEPPAEPYDPGKGKIGIVMCASVATGCVEMGKEAVRAAKAAGWEPTEPLDGKATPSVQSGLIDRLVAEKVDAIVLVAIQPEAVAAAIHSAVEAGIPVSDLYTPKDKDSNGVTLVTQNGEETGEFLARYIAANANAEGSTRVDVVGGDPAFKVLTERVAGVEHGLEKYCPECEMHLTHYSASEQTQPGPPSFSALLASNPPGTLEWVIGGPSDSFAEPILATAEQQGRTEIQMLGTDSSPKVLENLAEGGITKADTFSAYRYAGWAGVEEVIRQAIGLEPWNAEKLPFAYVTPENVEEAMADLPQWYTPPAFDYEKKFEELWSGK